MTADRPRANLSLEELASPEELALTQRVRDELSLLDTPAQIRACARAIEEYPDVVLLRVQAAQLHLNAGLCDQAVAILAQALSRFPEVTGLHHHYIQALIWNEDYNQAGQACLQLADLYVAQKNIDDYMDAVQLLLSLDPNHIEARKRLVAHLQEQGHEQMSLVQLSQLAEQASAQGLWAEALQAWQRLYDRQQNPLALERLGYLCQQLGRPSEAQHHYQQLLDYFEQQQRTLDAVSICDRLIELQPEALDLQHRQIGLLVQLGWKERLQDRQFALALAYQQRHQMGNALCLLHSVLDLNPQHEASLHKVVDIQLACGAYPEAVASGERLAKLYLEHYNLSGAIAVHLQLLGCLPENVGLRHNLAGLYELDNQVEQAVEQLEILVQQQAPVEAAESYRRILTFQPNRVDIRCRLAQLLEAGPALDCLRQAYALQPGYPGLAESLARALMHQGKVEEAAAVLRAHPHLTPTLCQTTQDPFCLGQLYYHLGQLDSAIERFQSTRRLPDYTARSYAMLGLCFAAKDGCNMLDLGIRQLCKGLELPGLSAAERQDLQATLDQLQQRRALS